MRPLGDTGVQPYASNNLKKSFAEITGSLLICFARHDKLEREIHIKEEEVMKVLRILGLIALIVGTIAGLAENIPLFIGGMLLVGCFFAGAIKIWMRQRAEAKHYRGQVATERKSSHATPNKSVSDSPRGSGQSPTQLNQFELQYRQILISGLNPSKPGLLNMVRKLEKTAGEADRNSHKNYGEALEQQYLAANAV
jgi:hypothetical protein